MLSNFREDISSGIIKILAEYPDVRALTVDEIRKFLVNEPQEFVPVIFPSGWINGLGILRGIGREGYKSIVMDPNDQALCFYSKYAIPYHCQKIINLNEKDEEALLNDLIHISDAIKSKNKKPVLFLTASEKLLPFVIKYHKDLSSRFIFSADFKNQLVLEDKKIQMEYAKKAGIDIPKTFCIDDEDCFQRALEHIIFPQVIKPRRGKKFYQEFGVQAFKAKSKTEAREIYQKVKKYQLIFQDEIQGPDDNLFTLGTYFDKENKPRAIFTGKKLKSNRDFGTCSVGISVNAPKIVNMGCSLLKEMQYHGASQIEFKLDERDNTYKFIEINNRLWKWHSLAIESNVNIPHIQFLDSMDKLDNHDLPDQINGKKWRMTLSDLYSEKKEVGIKETIESILSYGSGTVDGVGTWDDPLPALVNFLEFKWM